MTENAFTEGQLVAVRLAGTLYEDKLLVVRLAEQIERLAYSGRVNKAHNDLAQAHRCLVRALDQIDGL